MSDRNSSELILNSDGSVYHLALHPGELADTVILVGDPGRVEVVAKHFDSVEVSREKREFYTRTGFIGRKRLSVISTGISTSNVDIVLNEADAIVNMDLKTSTPLDNLQSLTFVRFGTSGAVQADIEIDSFVSTAYAIGFDGLDLHYPPDVGSDLNEMLRSANAFLGPEATFPLYCTRATADVVARFDHISQRGITLTCQGFYGPQGRQIRLSSPTRPFIERLADFSYDGLRVTNIEMESSGIYLLSSLLGHRAMSINAILANRANNQFSREPRKTVERLVEQSLEVLVSE